MRTDRQKVETGINTFSSSTNLWFGDDVREKRRSECECHMVLKMRAVTSAPHLGSIQPITGLFRERGRVLIGSSVILSLCCMRRGKESGHVEPC